MSLDGRVALGSASNNASLFISHESQIGLTGKRSILAVITNDTQTITSIVFSLSNADGAWTFETSHAAQGKKIWLYSKIAVAGVGSQYKVTLSPAAGSGLNSAAAFLADFAVEGDAIRTVDFADASTGPNLVLPSVSAPDAVDLWSFCWNKGATAAMLFAQSPLTINASGGVAGGTGVFRCDGSQAWNSSSATGTREYRDAANDNHTGALGAIMLVGSSSLGGWGVGSIRMNN